jgi:hypothetical protein
MATKYTVYDMNGDMVGFIIQEELDDTKDERNERQMDKQNRDEKRSAEERTWSSC